MDQICTIFLNSTDGGFDTDIIDIKQYISQEHASCGG